MMRNWKLWSGSLALVFLLASCATTAHVEKDDNADFKNVKTFAWIEKDRKDHGKTNSIAEQKLRDAVTKELAKSAGWKESANNPDILLSYDLTVEKTTQQKSDPVYTRPFTRTFYNPYSRRFINVYYPSRFLGYDNYDVPAKEGTVTITMLDAKTEKAVWQGWATEEVNSRNMTSKEIQSRVKAIFRKFDIAKN